MHIKSTQRVVFSFQVVLSKTRRVDNTLGKSILFAQVCLSRFFEFIDPFNNPIIKLMCYVLKNLIFLTPVAMRRRSAIDI